MIDNHLILRNGGFSMSDMLIPILLVLVGLVVGIIVMFIFYYIRGVKTAKTVETLIGNAKIEAEQIKKEY